MSGRSASAAVAVAVAIAAVIGAGMAFPDTRTATALPDPELGHVVERASVCPALRATADGAEAVTAFVAPNGGEGTGSISDGSAQAIALPEPGQAVRILPPESGTAVTVTAAGSAVGATTTVRTYLDPADEGRGLALGSCVSPRAQWWFAGVAATQGRVDELLLANPTESPAVVNVDVIGPAGKIDVVGAGGVVVQPGTQAAVRVDSLIPGTTNAALHVTTSGGLVAAVVRSTMIDGLIPLGAEYIPSAAEPSRSVVVPGVLPGGGARKLVIAAPDADAAVEIAYATADGTVRPSDHGQLPVPAGHTVAVALDKDLGGRAAAVVITSTAPVVAAVQSTLEAALDPTATGVLNRVPKADFAWSAGSAAIDRDWYLPMSGVAAAPATVLLSSLDAPVTVTVATRSAAGAVSELSVEVPADTTVSVPVPVSPDGASVVGLDRRGGAGRLFAAIAQIGSLDGAPIAAAAIGADPSTEVSVPLAYPDPQVLAGG